MPQVRRSGRPTTRSSTVKSQENRAQNDNATAELVLPGTSNTISTMQSTRTSDRHGQLQFPKPKAATISKRRGNLTPHEERMKVLEALDMNQSMQQEIMKHLSWIDDTIALNLKHMYEVRAMRWKGQRIQRAKAAEYGTVYKLPDFFANRIGEIPPLPVTPYESSAWQAYRSKPWTQAEREKLVQGIRTEAKRLMALDYHASGQDHLIWDIEKVDDDRLEMYSVERIDWKRVSRIHIPTRTPTECMIQWTTQEHPKINKTAWSPKENNKLMKLVKRYGKYGFWEKIAVELGSNRTVSQCFSHYQSQVNKQKTKAKWTKTEDRLLAQLVRSLGPRNWQQVAYMLGDRTGSQCLQRWEKVLNPAIRRTRWTEEEDTVLRNSVEVYGLGNWTKVQKHIPGRTDMQCRERWVNVLDPSLNHSKLDEQELKRLNILVAEHGNKWSMLTQYFPGRTDNQLLRAWKLDQRERGNGNEEVHDDEAEEKPGE